MQTAMVRVCVLSVNGTNLYGDAILPPLLKKSSGVHTAREQDLMEGYLQKLAQDTSVSWRER